MISIEIEAQILRLYHAEKWPIGTLARHLGVHHSVVRRVLEQNGIRPRRISQRPSIADPYLSFILDTLKQWPRLKASRLYEMVRERGYSGRPDHFRAIVARYRPRPSAEAYLRLRTLPGEQAQVDWAHFGKIPIGRARRPLMAFVFVLSWSRQIFVRFFLNQGMANFLRGHVEAFSFSSGVPRVVLYDNLRSAVLERRDEAIRFHPTLLELAAHYRYEPRPVAVARGNEKGRVERAIRYVRDAFFAARQWQDLDDLNAQALQWCRGPAANRKCPADRTLTVAEAFAREQSSLLALPEIGFPTEERLEISVDKTPYARFDLNDYSIPHTHVRRTLVVLATERVVRILDGNKLIATHRRCYDRDQQLEDPSHIAALEQHKRQAREHRAIDRLHHGAPSSRSLLISIAERGGALGPTTRELVRLLDAYGAQALEEAITEALKQNTAHLGAIRYLLDRKRQARGEPPPVPVSLPPDPRIRNLVVRPHQLRGYDALGKDSTDEDPT